MLRLPAVAGRSEGAKVTSGDKEQMSVGVTAVGVNAASARRMRVVGVRVFRVIGIDGTIRTRDLLQYRGISHHQLMPVRREHQVRDRNQHQKQDQGASLHVTEYTR